MILNQTQVDILTEKKPYNGSLLRRSWSYAILKDNVSPLGDVLSFCSPLAIDKLNIDNSLVIASELPSTNLFGGTAFMRLYLTQLGSILSEMVGKDCFVDESRLFVEQQQCSVFLINQVKETSLFNIVFSLNNSEAIANLNLSSEHVLLFQQKAIDCFHYLIKSVFIETKRDNF